MLYNSRYFFKPPVVRALGQKQKQEEFLNGAEFSMVMQAYGQSFLQPDIAVFRQNVNALSDINKKWNLFHKPAFYESMAVQFLTALIQTLLARSHDLLRDEIINCVYDMASVDFNGFFSDFLQNFLQSTADIHDNQRDILKEAFKADRDRPSFAANLLRFVNDLRYYRICNASLPAGSVTFQ